jgi:hypothetical protein
MINRTVVITAIVVWLLLSFVPALSLSSLAGMGKARKAG